MQMNRRCANAIINMGCVGWGNAGLMRRERRTEFAIFFLDLNGSTCNATGWEAYKRLRDSMTKQASRRRNPSRSNVYLGEKHVLPTEERRSVCMLNRIELERFWRQENRFTFRDGICPVTDFYSAATVHLLHFVSPLSHSLDVSNTPKIPWTV
jgi:hypothetical protein